MTRITGTAADNVYAVNQWGLLGHFDGMRWSKVSHDLFPVIDNMHECMDGDPATNGCVQGDPAKGFASTGLSILENGHLYIGVIDGTLYPHTGFNSGCEDE